MAWKNRNAHRVTLGFLSIKYDVDLTTLLLDPRIADLPFYNPHLSPGLRENELKIFAGLLTKYLATMQFDLEPKKTLDTAFKSFVKICKDGGNLASSIGDAVDENFKFKDEKSND